MVDYQRPSPHHTTAAYTNTSPASQRIDSTGQSYHRHSRSSSNPLNSSQQQSRRFSPAPNTMNTTIQREPTQMSTNTMNSAIPRRSTSSRSAASSIPTSYVALMRKQKATVWCDRAQSIDPRFAAQQRAAKHRAVLEVHGGHSVASGARTSTISSGGVVGKIRHGGVPKAPGYVPTANLTGAGVPMRLSAKEMLGDDENGDKSSLEQQTQPHRRTGSGRSSINSATFRSGYPRPANNTTPPEGPSPAGGIPEASERTGKDEYFDASQRRHTDSSEFAERNEDSFGSVGDLNAPNSAVQAVDQAKKAEDLRRRGSVDERAMTMSTGVRLYVANPDIEDH